MGQLKDLDLKTTIVFEHLQNSNKKITVMQGGTRSGKTYNILIWFLVKLLHEKNKVFTICRASHPDLRDTVMRDVVEILTNWGLYDEKYHNKTEHTYKFFGNLIECVSTDQPQKIRGRKRDYLFVNEANEIKYDAWMQLLFRTNGKIVIDYNPSMEFHWIYDKVLIREDIDFYVTTYLDNLDNLPQSLIDEIEFTRKADPNYWQWYGLGQRGSAKGRVYTHYNLCRDFPLEGETIYGLDFGFNDPTALVQVEIFDKCIYAKTLLYETDLKATQIVERLKQIGLKPTDLIYADSARPEIIKEIRQAGFNIKPCKKGANSVIEGIHKVQSMPLFIYENSLDLRKEIDNYSWKSKNDTTIDEPCDGNDHALDALRYAVFTHLGTMKRNWAAFRAINGLNNN